MSTITRRASINFDKGTLEPVQHAELNLNGWYYLGASLDPKLIKIVKLESERFWYVTGFSLTQELNPRPIQIERWVGEDLIARASATIRKQANDGLSPADPYPWVVERCHDLLYMLSHGDLPEDWKQQYDNDQARLEVLGVGTDAENRAQMLAYEIEDALRWQYKEQVRNSDYDYTEDHNVYPRDTQEVYTTVRIKSADFPDLVMPRHLGPA